MEPFRKVGSDNFYTSFYLPGLIALSRKLWPGWSLFGFPSGPLPVYVPFRTKETAKTVNPTAPLAVYPRFNCPTVVGVDGPMMHVAVASKIQLPIGISC